MSSSINVRRYTRGVLNYAQQTNTLDRWRQDLTVLLTLGEDRAIRHFLEDPRLPVAERMAVVSRAVGDSVSAAGQDLLAILIEDRAVRVLTQLARQVLREADRIEGIVRVHVTSAVPLTDDLRRQLRQTLAGGSSAQPGSSQGPRTVILQELVDPAIIGGFILREEDRLLDLSVHASLKAMEEQLARI